MKRLKGFLVREVDVLWMNVVCSCVVLCVVSWFVSCVFICFVLVGLVKSIVVVFVSVDFVICVF